ncbi:YisL family protein [Virgibacillus sp. NKC19-16]|uniref:YisL family protein n=1 Tax=Virgibacillus salidurans TaxID=2831673 RepID=UPI001F2412CA|nr:YisL family protein [Virgibacillus sp. NKC19-16]UJL47601.1 YisL family protein [Virgibacillus sp. NKC19-16]
MNTHLHVTSWVLAFILFAVAYILHKQGKAKGSKIVQMILRLDYLLILYSGGALLANYFSGSAMMGEAIFKGIAGIWAVLAMEMILVKMTRREPTKSWWIQAIIAIVITIALGFGRLPGGFLP